jgi:hypothetical protein
MKYAQHPIDEDGWTEWLTPQQAGYRQRCCDCGLTHEMEFRTMRGRVQYRARRHERATAASRRGKP